MMEPVPAGRVLLVDDEPLLLRAYTRWLRNAGLVVESAPDGRTAARMIAESRFDVIVSDIMMSGMDGVQLLQAVRERDLDVPVVLMTGTPTVGTAISAVELGALRYLVKPFTESVLRGVVAHAQRLYRLAKLKREAVLLVGQGNNQVGDLMGLGTSLDRALDGMWMAYQPIVVWSRRQVYAFEALLRSNEPTLPHPEAVFHAAERLDRLVEVGRMIRDRVAAVVDGASSVLMFVNLHTRDLLDDALYLPTAALSKVARSVVLEITERVSLDEVTDAAIRVARLRTMGFRIAVDDLGAGFAGLTSFTRLEPEVVKFDMSLVRGLHESTTKQKLIQAMAALFRELDITAIAEGVETTAERDALVSCGCDLFQGYLFARPGGSFPVPIW